MKHRKHRLLPGIVVTLLGLQLLTNIGLFLFARLVDPFMFLRFGYLFIGCFAVPGASIIASAMFYHVIGRVACIISIIAAIVFAALQYAVTALASLAAT